MRLPNYIQLYTCDIGGWLDSDMKINYLRQVNEVNGGV